MFVRIYSAVVSGPTVQPVTVEVASSRTSLPTISLIGLPGASVLESKDRVFSALRNLGVSLPHKRIVISLRPVEVQKSGSSLDLAIALGVLMVQGLVPNKECAAVGELGLDGSLHAGPEYPALLQVLDQYKEIYAPAGLTGRVWPRALITQRCCAPSSLAQLFSHLTGSSCLLPVKPMPQKRMERAGASKTMVVSRRLLRAVTLCLAGGHHLLLFGSPGVGKTYARQLVEQLFPEETERQAEERCIRESLWSRASPELQPVISPHHSASLAGLVGGGTIVRPGAISLAHRGVLFLDEIPEFSRQCLEALRQPLETDSITLVRGAGSWRLPCSFTLVGTANPCPCGFRGTDACRCRDKEVAKYIERISGPVLDRVDLQLRVTTEDRIVVSAKQMFDLLQKITRTRRHQEKRESLGLPAYARQYEISHLESMGWKLHSPIPAALTRNWSLRRWLKLWRVTQTIADLAGRQAEEEDILEAFGFVRPAYGEIIARPGPL